MLLSNVVKTFDFGCGRLLAAREFICIYDNCLLFCISQNTTQAKKGRHGVPLVRVTKIMQVIHECPWYKMNEGNLLYTILFGYKTTSGTQGLPMASCHAYGPCIRAMYPRYSVNIKTCVLLTLWNVSNACSRSFKNDSITYCHDLIY